jgi:hypothetical protein
VTEADPDSKLRRRTDGLKRSFSFGSQGDQDWVWAEERSQGAEMGWLGVDLFFGRVSPMIAAFLREEWTLQVPPCHHCAQERMLGPQVLELTQLFEHRIPVVTDDRWEKTSAATAKQTHGRLEELFGSQTNLLEVNAGEAVYLEIQ